MTNPTFAVYELHYGDVPPNEDFVGWLSDKKLQGVRFHGATSNEVERKIIAQWEVWEDEGEKARLARAERAAKKAVRERKITP